MSPIVINIYQVKINSFENGSAVNIGQNLLADWTNNDKRNQGYGQSYGDESRFVGTQGFIDDRDNVDAPAQKITASSPLPPLFWSERSKLADS